jgi:hypothetical protein
MAIDKLNASNYRKSSHRLNPVCTLINVLRIREVPFKLEGCDSHFESYETAEKYIPEKKFDESLLDSPIKGSLDAGYCGAVCRFVVDWMYGLYFMCDNAQIFDVWLSYF